jgi:hypothetical protein
MGLGRRGSQLLLLANEERLSRRMSRRISGSERERRTVVKRIEQRVLVPVEVQFLFHARYISIFDIR